MRLFCTFAALVLLQPLPGAPNKDSKPGGPGATPPAKRLPEEMVKERSFRLALPADIHLKPGQRRDIPVDLDTGIDFHQTVQLYFEAPKGIRVSPAHAQIPGGQKQTTITLMADADVDLGDQNLRIMGEPESGQSVLMNVPLHVDRSR